jgi:hypothetical protein
MALGLNMLEFISALSPSLSRLSKIKSFKKLDKSGLSIFQNVEFMKIPNYKTKIAIITHPTYWHLNVGNRKYKDWIGKDAEKNLIRELI